MRKKEDFMTEGAKVLVVGAKGTITKVIGAPKPYQEYAIAIHVLIDGNQKAGKYDPFDVEVYDPSDLAQKYLDSQKAKINYHNQLINPN